MSSARARARLRLAALLLLALAIRLLAVRGAGYPSDPTEVARWAVGVRDFGLGGFYEHVQGGYYPAALYLLAPLAALLRGDALYLAVKGLVIPFDLATGVVLYLIVRRGASERAALLAAALYLLNPAAIIGGAYWGQVDGIGALGMLLVVLALGARRWVWAGALTAVSGLFKATFGIIGIVVGAASLVALARRRAWRPAAASILGLVVGYALVAVPIRLGPLDYLGLVREGGVRFPFTSLYALNPWFILVGFFKPDDPYVALGGILLICGVAVSLAPLWYDRRPATLLAVAGFITLAFYFLPTRVHERYLFPAIVLFAPFAAVRPRLRWPYLTLSLAFAVGLAYTLWMGSQSTYPVPPLVERTIFTLPGMGAVALALMAGAGVLVWRLARGEATLSPDGGAPWLFGPPRPPARDAPPRAAPSSAAAAAAAARRPASLPPLPGPLRALVARVRARPTDQLAAWLAVAAAAAFVAVGTAAELIRTVGLNDTVYHFRLVADADRLISEGGNPFDFWLPELEQGFPVFVYYQHFAHLAVVLLGRLTFGLIDLRTIFDLVRWALMAALPLTAYRSLRWAGFPRGTAAIAGASAVLLSSSFAFGLELDNYLWRGYGLYTQLWGAHLAFVAFAALYRLQERKGSIVVAFLALTALALTHLVYGYMAALTLVVLTFAGMSRRDARARLVRLCLVGGLSAAASLYMLVPFLTAQPWLLVSQYLPQYRFDGFGLARVVGGLVRGEILDAGRLPIVTALMLVGIAAALVRRERQMLLTLLLFLVWVVLFAGKPVTDLLPLHGGLPVHRFVGSVQLFAVILAGYGGMSLIDVARALLARAGAPGSAPLFAVAALALLFVPVARERAVYFEADTRWITATDVAVRADADAARIVAALAQRPPGRVTAGIRETWGDRLDFGLGFKSARFFDLVTNLGFDTVRPPAYSFSLASDVLFEFDPQRPAVYDLWNARYVVAPPSQVVPPELTVLLQTARYTLYEAPTTGYAEYVAIADRIGIATQTQVLPENLRWLRSDALERRAFLRYDFPAPAGSRGAAVPGCAAPQYFGETVASQRLAFDVACPTAATLVVKETYHPYLRATVDGVATETFMVSPGFVALAVPPGRHAVVVEYGGAPGRTPLILVGLAVTGLAIRFRGRIAGLAAALGSAGGEERDEEEHRGGEVGERAEAHVAGEGDGRGEDEQEERTPEA